jgi:hypothetical protein
MFLVVSEGGSNPGELSDSTFPRVQRVQHTILTKFQQKSEARRPVRLGANRGSPTGSTSRADHLPLANDLLLPNIIRGGKLASTRMHCHTASIQNPLFTTCDILQIITLRQISLKNSNKYSGAQVVDNRFGRGTSDA